jgi:hypothetical protein
MYTLEDISSTFASTREPGSIPAVEKLSPLLFRLIYVLIVFSVMLLSANAHEYPTDIGN